MARGKNYKEYLDSVLNEQDQTYIREFFRNERMAEAIKKGILAGLYEQGRIKQESKADSLTNIAFSVLFGGMKTPKEISNEEVGRELKILWEAVNLLELSFEEMAKFNQTVEPISNKGNPAR